MDPFIVARAFLFYTIGCVFFPNANSMILIGWLPFIEHVDKVGSYDWGSAILARIYYGLDVYSRCHVKSLDYFWQFIEVGSFNMKTYIRC